jgi:hypothetical protein
MKLEKHLIKLDKAHFRQQNKGVICVTGADECKDQGGPGRGEVAERVTQLALLLERLTHIHVMNSCNATQLSTQFIFVSCRWTCSCRGESVSSTSSIAAPSAPAAA